MLGSRDTLGILWMRDSSNTTSRPCRASRVEADHFDGGLSRRNRGSAQRPRMLPQTETRKMGTGSDNSWAERSKSAASWGTRADRIQPGRNPVWLWLSSHGVACMLSQSYSPIRGSSTPQSLPDCFFLALAQRSVAPCQPGEEGFRRFGHKFPRQVTGQVSKSLHIHLTHLKSVHALRTQPGSFSTLGKQPSPLCPLSPPLPDDAHSRPGISELPVAASGAPEIFVGADPHWLLR